MKRLTALFLMALFMGTNTFADSSVQKANQISEGPGRYKLLKESGLPVRIPFTMHNGKPLMKLTINGKPATLMIDNGILWDEVWMFGTSLVAELNLKPVDQAIISGAGEEDPTDAFSSTGLTLAFKDIVFYEQPSYVSPPAAGFARMFPGADGQLCNTFFKHFVVEFDFIHNQVILHDPKTFTYTDRGCALDLKLNESGTHAVPFSFTMNDGKTYTSWTDIDFGGIYNFKIALNNSLNIQLPVDVKPARSRGASGIQHEYVGHIRSFTIGPYTFEHPEVHFGDETTSRIHPDNLGVIGLPLFMKFDIIFDYIHHKLYLEPNDHAYKDPGFNPQPPTS